MTASAINIVVCIGCDDYVAVGLSKLNGAVSDSKRLYEALTASGLYDLPASKLLLSPTVQDVRTCLNDVARYKNLGVLTFYFAGHGGIKSGTFYLCVKDSDVERLSTTGLPIFDLFAVIGEIQPRQVNFIIDACQSAGAMFDLSALMKPDVIGRAGSSSIAFLAASASDQYAGETSSGGIATTATLKYLNGDRQLQQHRPYLDLVEVGLAVSRDVLKDAPDQNPVAWGLNLYGDGILAINPHYAEPAAGPLFSVDGIAPASTAGQLVRRYTEPLWEEYRAIATDHDPRRLRRTVLNLRSELKDDFASFIRGYAPALASRAAGAEDLLAASDALGVCAISMLPEMDNPTVAQTCRDLLQTRIGIDHRAIEQLTSALKRDRYCLLAPGYALPDLHYLPMRVSQLLAWVGLSRLADTVFAIDDPAAVGNSNALVELVFQHYGDSFVAVSDEQAAWTMIFGALADQFGWSEKAGILVEKLFAADLAVAGRILRPDASGTDAFNYSLARAGMNSPIGPDEFANPTELLSVLFLLAHRVESAARCDKSISALDGITMNAYVPDNYMQFSEPLIPGGNNFTYRIGHGIWTLAEYAAVFKNNVAPSIQAAALAMTPVASLLCGVSSCIFPDRVPYFLGQSTTDKPLTPTA